MIAFGADHLGYGLKDTLISYLKEKGMETADFGCDGTDSVDYPIYAAKVTEAVLRGEARFGVLVCGTGLGMSMMANRFDGIRAALCTNELMARMARAHNDANILVMGSNIVGPGLARAMADAFLATPFDAGRHVRRIGMFDDASLRGK